MYRHVCNHDERCQRDRPGRGGRSGGLHTVRRGHRPDAVIDESLRRATDDRFTLDDASQKLGGALTQSLPDRLTDADLVAHPLAVWVELALGLEDGQTLKRRPPAPFGEAVEKLAEASGHDASTCRKVLKKFLTRVCLPENDRGGAGDSAFLAFKLHRFIAGAGDVFATLRSRPRSVQLEGQIEDPGAPGTRLYPIRFCRQCGQEYYVVTRTERSDGTVFVPRDIDDTPIMGDDDIDVAGYLTPVASGDQDYRFDGTLRTFPTAGWKIAMAY